MSGNFTTPDSKITFKLSRKRLLTLFFLVAFAIIGAIPINFAIESTKRGPIAFDLNHKDQIYLVQLTYTHPYLAHSILISGFLFYLIGWILQNQQAPQEESYKDSETLSARNRRILIINTRQFIDDQLDQLLQDRPLLVQHMHDQTALVLTSLPQDSDVSSNTTLLQWFDTSQSQLLILGDPGMGKTTSLLSLAQLILDRAKKDNTTPIPILLNLSSWTSDNKSLEDWIINEISKSSYDIPHQLTRKWLKDGTFLPLLDNLDKVPGAIRSECVHSINLYNPIKDTSSPMIICCNTQEYTALIEPLQINRAISLDLLTDEQIKIYLNNSEKGIKLCQMVDKEPDLHTLAQIPLMLSMLSICPGDSYADISSQNSLEEQQYSLFNHYVATQLDYQTKLQPHLLKHQGIYRLLIMIIEGITGGVIGSLIGRLAGGLLYWIIGGISFGLIWGLAYGLGDINIRDQPLIDTEKITHFFEDSLAIGLGMGIFFGIISETTGKFNFDIVDGIIIGIAVSLIVGLVISIIDGISTYLGIGITLSLSRPDHLTNKANKNILQMGKDGFICGLGIGLVSGIGIGLGGGIEIGVTIGIVIWIITGLGIGLLDYIRHYLIRFMLAREKSLPFDTTRFLNNAVKCMILCRIGVKYSFIHESIREHFIHKQEE
jgi:hypothetical protein